MATSGPYLFYYNSPFAPAKRKIPKRISPTLSTLNSQEILLQEPCYPIAIMSTQDNPRKCVLIIRQPTLFVSQEIPNHTCVRTPKLYLMRLGLKFLWEMGNRGHWSFKPNWSPIVSQRGHFLVLWCLPVNISESRWSLMYEFAMGKIL